MSDTTKSDTPVISAPAATVVSFSEGTLPPSEAQTMVDQVETEVDAQDADDSGSESAEAKADREAVAEGEDIFMMDLTAPKKPKNVPPVQVKAARTIEAADEEDDESDTVVVDDDGNIEDGGPTDEDGPHDDEPGHPDQTVSLMTVRDGAVISVYKEQCLQCGHLVAFEEHRYKDCHYSKGNESCPAKYVKITKYINTDEIVGRFMRAKASGDYGKLGKMYVKLDSMETWKQVAIKEALQEAEAQAVLAAQQ